MVTPLQPQDTIDLLDGDGRIVRYQPNKNLVGTPSLGNTTTTPLGSGETFTGEFEQSDAPDVMVSCQTDNGGTLYFDYSVDGINFSTFPSNGFAVASGIHEFHTAIKGPRWFRVRLVNDTGAQTYLRLYIYFGTFRQGNAPLNQNLGNDADAIVTRMIPPMVDLATGKLGGIEQKDKFGYTDGLGTAIQLGTPSTWVDVWTYGGLRTEPTSSFTPYIASSNDSDTQDIEVPYLDANGLEQTTTVTLNGQTPVSLGVTATDVVRMWNADNTDTLGTVYLASANNFTAGVPDNQNEVLVAFNPNDQQSQLLAFAVPSNKRAIITAIDLELSRANGSNGAADIALEVKESGGVWRARRKYQLVTGGAAIRPDLLNLPAGSKVRVRVRDVSDANSAIAGTISYLQILE